MSYLEPYLLHEYIIAGLGGKEVALGRQQGKTINQSFANSLFCDLKLARSFPSGITFKIELDRGWPGKKELCSQIRLYEFKDDRKQS
jgi:hypothetical protein